MFRACPLLLTPPIDKVKVKSLCIIKHHAMTYGGVELQLHAFLTSALDGDERSASRFSRFNPGEIVPGIHSDRRLSGYQSRSGSESEEKNSLACRKLNTGRPVRNLVTILTELSLGILYAQI
jgi:hypothetical protein